MNIKVINNLRIEVKGAGSSAEASYSWVCLRCHPLQCTRLSLCYLRIQGHNPRHLLLTPPIRHHRLHLHSLPHIRHQTSHLQRLNLSQRQKS